MFLTSRFSDFLEVESANFCKSKKNVSTKGKFSPEYIKR